MAYCRRHGGPGSKSRALRMNGRRAKRKGQVMYTGSEIREPRMNPVRVARWQRMITTGRERDARSEFAREIENAVQEIATARMNSRRWIEAHAERS